MKSGILKNVNELVVETRPDPSEEEDTIIIRVQVCSICASDLNTFRHGHPRVKFPQTLGHEISGEVVTAVDGATGLRTGDRVTVCPSIFCGKCFYCLGKEYTHCVNCRTLGYELPGGFATHLIIPLTGMQPSMLIRIPDNLGYEEASLAEPLSCCLRAQKASRVGEGDVVVVIGGGPIGIMHCRLARINGAKKVILIQRDLKRLQGVRLDSLDDIIDSTETDPVDKIFRLTDKRGADVVIVACSSVEAQTQSTHLAGQGGRINFFGRLNQGQSKLVIDSNAIHYREISIQGTRGSTPQDCRAALEILASKILVVGDLITHTFPVDSIQKAFLFAESKKGMHVAICP